MSVKVMSPESSVISIVIVSKVIRSIVIVLCSCLTTVTTTSYCESEFEKIVLKKVLALILIKRFGVTS